MTSDEDTRERFADLCKARFGTGWQVQFARHAGIHPQTVTRWMNDNRPPQWAMVLMQEWNSSRSYRVVAAHFISKAIRETEV